MPIRNLIVWAIGALLFIGCQNSFVKAGRTIQAQGSNAGFIDSFYSSLQKRYQLIVAYHAYNPSGVSLTDHRYVFAYNSITAAKGFIYTKPLVQTLNNIKENRIDSINLPHDAAEALLSQFKESKGWNLSYDDTNDDSLQNDCFYITHKQCYILHGETYQAAFIYKKRQAISLLYAPDKYEKQCCSGNINRQKFIAIKSIIDGAFKEAGLLSR